MTYKTLLVNLDISGNNAGLLHVAAELATRFDADVIGSANCQPIQLYYGDGFISGDLVQQDLAEIEEALARTEQQFRSALGSRAGRIEWHAGVTFAPLSDAVVNDARGADLILSSADIGGQHNDAHHVNTSDLLMRAGRPVLVVPDSLVTLPLNQILVGWKDTKESRRAIFDALPLLKSAKNVTVVEIAAPPDITAAKLRLASVTTWLSRHDIVAHAEAIPSDGDHAVDMLSFAKSRDVDLIVAGAYGHSRLREWVLGGVTRALLADTRICSMMSH